MKSKGVFEIPINQIEIVQGLLPRVYTHTLETKIEEYKEAMAEGAEFPPIVVWHRGNDIFWLIDGVHRLTAAKRLGREYIKAEVVELENELEARLLAIEKNATHGIPLTREEKVALARLLYADGVEIERLTKLFRISVRTLYNWVDGIRRRTKDEELKKQALELRKQGLNQKEIAEKLGLPKQTISVWLNENNLQVQNVQKLQVLDRLLSSDGTPTAEGYEAISKFIEQNEETLKDKAIEEVIKERAPELQKVWQYIYEGLKRDFKRFTDAPSYEKVRVYLSTIEPYRELSPKARKVLFEKVEPLWEKLKKEYEEILKLEQEVLELAKKILSDPRYVFHSWRKLREDLWRIGRMDHWRIYGNEGRIEEILSRNADILMEIYRKFPEPTTDSLSDEEILKVAENVKEEKDKWVRRGKIREEVERLLETKGLRIVPAVVEEAIKKVEKLIEEETETKETRETKIDWAEIEKIEKQIKEETPEEKWEELKRQFEASKEQRKEEKKAKEEEGALPDPEELYRQKLRTLLMDMGLKLGWVKAFQIAEEVYEEVREYAKRSVRGW